MRDHPAEPSYLTEEKTAHSCERLSDPLKGHVVCRGKLPRLGLLAPSFSNIKVLSIWNYLKPGLILRRSHDKANFFLFFNWQEMGEFKGPEIELSPWNNFSGMGFIKKESNYSPFFPHFLKNTEWFCKCYSIRHPEHTG